MNKKDRQLIEEAFNRLKTGVDDIKMKKKFQHFQHSTEFYQKELNAPNKNTQQPFRLTDERWVIGKNKGMKVSETPKTYIKWVLGNFNHLSPTHKSILKKLLN